MIEVPRSISNISLTPDLKVSQSFVSRENGLPDVSGANDLAPQPAKKKRRALVVDDVADVTDMLEVLLTHAGYEVVTASSAADALAIARHDRFDVVISDIGMPEMNGYELAQALRSVQGYETIPMVAVTGYAMFNDYERSLHSGFNAHMTKPIDPRALLELIEQL
jgi:CheY-like chemotaxis protein